MRKRQLPSKQKTDTMVTIAEMVRQTGVTDPAWRGRIRRGELVLGKHFERRGKRIMLYKDACNQFWGKG